MPLQYISGHINNNYANNQKIMKPKDKYKNDIEFILSKRHVNGADKLEDGKMIVENPNR